MRAVACCCALSLLAATAAAEPIIPKAPAIPPPMPMEKAIGPPGSGAFMTYQPPPPGAQFGLKYRPRYPRTAGAHIFGSRDEASKLNHFNKPFYWNVPCERLDYSPYRYSIRQPKIYSPIYLGGESPPQPHLYPNSFYSSYSYYPAVKPTATGRYLPARIYYHQRPKKHYKISTHDYYYHCGCAGELDHRRSCALPSQW